MEGTKTTESNRDRVRRLLFVPLDFRLKRGADKEAAKKAQDGLADDLSYLRDGELDQLRRMMEVNGEGKARDQWPSLSTFRSYANLIHPRPLTELPNLRSWFGSCEGPKALQAGELVETYEFFQRRRRPPVRHGERRTITDQARQNRRRLEYVEGRIAGGWDEPREDRDWVDGYRRKEAELIDLVNNLTAAKQVSA